MGLFFPAAELWFGTAPAICSSAGPGLASSISAFHFLLCLGLWRCPLLAIPKVPVYYFGPQGGHGFPSLTSTPQLLLGLAVGRGLLAGLASLWGQAWRAVFSLSGQALFRVFRQAGLCFISLSGQAGLLLGLGWFLPRWLRFLEDLAIEGHSDGALPLCVLGAACIFSLASFKAEEECRAAPFGVVLKCRQQVCQRDLSPSHERLPRQEVHPDGGGSLFPGELGDRNPTFTGSLVLASPVPCAGEPEGGQLAAAVFLVVPGHTQRESVWAAALTHHLKVGLDFQGTAPLTHRFIFVTVML